MGSWHETCKLTNLPVKPNDPVVWLAVVEQEYKESPFVYSDGFYAPISFPLHGIYGDYGDIKDITNPESVEYFKSYISKGMEENRIEYDNDGEEFDINSVLEYVERGYLKIDSREISYIFMHKHAYDKLITLQGSRRPYESLMTCTEEMRTYFSRLKSKKSTMTAEEKLIASCTNDVYRIKLFGDIYLNMSVEDDFYNKDVDLIEEIIEMSNLRNTFCYGRYSWIPMCGRGSQDADLHIASEMAKATLEYIQRDYDRCDRYEEDDSSPCTIEEYVEATPFIYSILNRLD